MIATKIIEKCIEKRYTIAAAESCTGGQLIAALIAVSGASAVIEVSFVTYNNDAKVQYAHVQPKTLKTHGAVSSETANEMAQGVAKEANATIGVAITGIAGPTGGTKEKPVGTVYISIWMKDQLYSKAFAFEGNRYEIQAQTVNAALALLGEVVV